MADGEAPQEVSGRAGGGVCVGGVVRPGPGPPPSRRFSLSFPLSVAEEAIGAAVGCK